MFRVIVGTSYWSLNGVNRFCENLVRGLNERDVRSELLLTEQKTDLINITDPVLPLPTDIPVEFLPVSRTDGWGAHWGSLIRYLESRGPCIYLPNADWRHSCVCPRLSKQVGVIGVVHSDDPMHYEHVKRLGSYWDAIVTVSHATADRTIQEMPALKRKVEVIPIGVKIPDSYPEKQFGAAGPIRLVYHGVLNQRQKRILDLPKIVEELQRRKIPVELTIAGGGEQQEELLSVSQKLIQQGLIRFLGVLSHSEVMRMLEKQHIFLMTSLFEGMPNALLEAMSVGCVPIVTDIKSGIPEVLHAGRNGEMLPVGNIGQFADKIAALHSDRTTLARMSRNSYESIRNSPYNVEKMVDSYSKLMQRVMFSLKVGRRRKTFGPIKPPPAEIDHIRILPITYDTHISGVGDFPSFDDYQHFRKQLKRSPDHPQSPEPRTETLQNVQPIEVLNGLASFRVIVGLPYMRYSGINDYSENLVIALRNRGINAEILLTEQRTTLITPSEKVPEISEKPWIQYLPVAYEAGWGAHWSAMICYLESRRPCIYLPNYDWRHSCVVPLLSDKVIVIGNIFSEDALYSEQISRIGKYWNAIVAADSHLAPVVTRLDPELSRRMDVIPMGAAIPPKMITREESGNEILRILYYGSLEPRSPALLLLKQIIERLNSSGVKISITLISSNQSPAAENEIYNEGLPTDQIRVVESLSHADLLSMFERHDILLTTAGFDGIANILLEAMGRGCIPVTVKIPGVVPSCIQTGKTGFQIPPSDVEAFAQSIASLREEAFRKSVREAAYLAARDSAYTIEDMTDQYIEFFQRAVSQHHKKIFRRPFGPIATPPAKVDGTEILPIPYRYVDRTLGSFPSRREYVIFQKEILKFGRSKLLLTVALLKHRVVSYSERPTQSSQPVVALFQKSARSMVRGCIKAARMASRIYDS